MANNIVADGLLTFNGALAARRLGWVHQPSI
jgi:hypothetical protein